MRGVYGSHANIIKTSQKNFFFLLTKTKKRGKVLTVDRRNDDATRQAANRVEHQNAAKDHDHDDDEHRHRDPHERPNGLQRPTGRVQGSGTSS